MNKVLSIAGVVLGALIVIAGFAVPGMLTPGLMDEAPAEIVAWAFYLIGGGLIVGSLIWFTRIRSRALPQTPASADATHAPTANR